VLFRSLENENASNVYCWQNICDQVGCTLSVIKRTGEECWADILSAQIALKDVDIVAVSNVHWCDGSVVDLQKISDVISSFSNDDTFRKPYFVIDGTQSVGALPIDVGRLNADFMACSVHKWLLSPYGMCLVYLRPAHHGDWEPLDHHDRQRLNSDNPAWDEVGSMTDLGYPTAFKQGARRLDSGGRPNPVVLASLRVSLALILAWTPEAIQSYLSVLTDSLAERVSAMNCGLEVLPKEQRSGHILGLRCSSECAYTVPELVSALRQRGVFVSARVGVVRVSPHIYNTMDDVDKFMVVLGDILASPPSSDVGLPRLAPLAPRVKVLVTGCTGWLGQLVCKELLGQPVHLIGAFHVQNPPDWLPIDQCVRMSLEDPSSVQDTIRTVLPDVVVHLAAISSPAVCAKDPRRAQTVNCPTSLTEALRKYVPSCVLIFSSTDLVYDGENAPYDAILEPSPIAAYGQTKLAFEREVLSLANGVVLRLSNMVGPAFAYRPCGTKFLQWLQEACAQRERVGLRCDEVRSFVDVHDVIEVIRIIIERRHCESSSHGVVVDEGGSRTWSSSSRGVFNMGGPRAMSRLEMARLVARAAGVPFVVEDKLPTEAEAEPVAREEGEGEGAETATSPWLVFPTTNEEAVRASGIQNPRDVTMNISKTEIFFNLTFTDLEYSILKYARLK